MTSARLFYNVGYRLARMPWETGPREELVELVESGRLRPGRAVDLGCGTGANAMFLAERGFDVTGVDFAPTALAKARAAANGAGVVVRFVEADLTDLRVPLGTFDVLVDYSTLDELAPSARDRYVSGVVPLARPGAQFLLWCFEWMPRRRDRLVGLRSMAPGEVEQRFGSAFQVERISATPTPDMRRLVPAVAVYLMTRSAA